MISLDVAPPGREKQVKALKTAPGVDNPYAVSWASYGKGKDGAEGIFTQGGLALNAGTHGDVIRKRGGSFALYSKKTNKVIATHKTREGALAQERAIQAHKHGDAINRASNGEFSSGGGGGSASKGKTKSGPVKVAEAMKKYGPRGYPSLGGAGKGARAVGKGAHAVAKGTHAIAKAPLHGTKHLGKEVLGAAVKGAQALGRGALWTAGKFPTAYRKRGDEVSRVPKGQHGGGRFAPKGGGGGGGSSKAASKSGGGGAGHAKPAGEASMGHGAIGEPIRAAPVEISHERKAELAKQIEHHVASTGPKTSSELQHATGASKAEVQAATHHLVKGGSHYVEGRTGRVKERVRLPNAAEGGTKPWKKHVAAGIRGALEGAAVGAGIGAAAGEGIGAIPGATVGAGVGAGAGVLASYLEEPSIARTAPAITKQSVAEAGRRQKEKAKATGAAPPKTPKVPPTKTVPAQHKAPLKAAPAPIYSRPNMNSADLR